MAKKNNGEVTGWVGWVGFASFMLLLAGFFHMIAGFVALLKDEVYVIGEKNIWILDYTQWGWIHVIGGLLAIIAAMSLLQGHMYGRIIAVIVAALSAIANMAFVPVYPVWSIMIIVIDILVIYAVTVHAGELRED